MVPHEWGYGFNESLNFLNLTLYAEIMHERCICANVCCAWCTWLCKSLITGWLRLDVAILNPVLSQNSFRQRFSKPPMEVCTDPWTWYWILVKKEYHSDRFGVNLYRAPWLFLLCTWGSKAVELFQRANLAISFPYSLRLGYYTDLVRFSSDSR